MHTARAPYAVQHDYHDYDYDYGPGPPAAARAQGGTPPAGHGANAVGGGSSSSSNHNMTPAAALVHSWRTNAAVALDAEPSEQQQPRTRSPGGHHDHDAHRSRHRSPKPSRTARAPSGLSAPVAPFDQQHRYGLPPDPRASGYRPGAHANHRAAGSTVPQPPPLPSSSQRQHAGPAPPSSSSRLHSQNPASRSRSSLATQGGSSGKNPSSRQHASRNTYDADYDRQRPVGPSAASSLSRNLFDPRAPAPAGSSSSRRQPGASASPRRNSDEPRSWTRHGSSTASTVSPYPSTASTLHPGALSHAAPDLPSLPPFPRASKRGSKDDRSTAARGSTRAPSEERRPGRSKREPVQLADLGRRAGTGSGAGRADGAGASRGQAPGEGKDSQESLESLQTDFSGRTKSSGAGGRRRRRAGADGEGDEVDMEAGPAVAGASAKSRQLFDPRKDDPMRFAAPRAGSIASTSTKPGPHSGLTGSTFTLQTDSVMNLSNEAYGADDAASVNTGASGHASASSKRPDHPILGELKKAYRGILELEKKLQDENRRATRDGEREADASSGGPAASGAGVKIRGQGKKYDDEYWVKLAKAHKQLAEAHYSFLQMALDPHIPAGLHSLPQRYNIPTRLWQVAFHQLLERMRHAVTAAPPTSSATQGSEANVLDHLIEFIQFAYTHYSQLFEDPTVAVFRAAWIEQLGDLARYRMAVAGLASRVHGSHGRDPLNEPTPASLSDDEELALGASASDAGQPAPAPARGRPADAASIGQAALNDWDLEEQETWREMAREWYALGLAESPGTGRLQHHLALLSKGDELRALYHYTKSLTVAHPYLSARESILPLFEEEHQARRTQSDVSQHELFVHLHGMLFTKISLDDFEDCLERFLERLRQESWASEKARASRQESIDREIGPAFSDREWTMLGVINIAALLQYGAEDGVLRKLMAPDPAEPSEVPPGTASSKRHHGHGRTARPESSRGGPSKSSSAPQALMMKRNEGEGANASPAMTDNLGDDDASEPGGELPDDLVKQLQPAATTEPEDDPLPFKLAQRLAFSVLATVLDMPFFRVGAHEVPNPYVTILATFLAHISYHPAAMKHLERSVPWSALAGVFNRVSLPVEIRLDTPSRLVGGKPLPEDHCLRGMEWAGRQLFGRGYWREPRSRSNAASPASGLGDNQPPPIEGLEGTTIRIENEADALKFDLANLHGGASVDAALNAATEDEYDEAGLAAHLRVATLLSEGRWRRLAICAAWLVRNVAGFDCDLQATEPSQRFAISGALRNKLDEWKREDDDAREAERLSRLALEDRTAGSADDLSTEGDDSDEEDYEDEEDSAEVKELKARRRQLKSIIRQARTATRGPRAAVKSGSRAKLGGRAAAVPHVFPGYTILVFDTNILLTSLTLLSELVAAECWTIVLPLAVITELDGLKRNSTPLGTAAAEAIDYLELAVRGYSRYLKIQTSRGNYLKDLAIRNEAIDFGGGADGTSSHDLAQSLDDVILRAAAWQKEHFSDRLTLVNPHAVAAGRKVPSDTAPVVLITFDRNLRLKASARGLDATDEKGLKKAIEATPAPYSAGGAPGG